MADRTTAQDSPWTRWASRRGLIAGVTCLTFATVALSGTADAATSSAASSSSANQQQLQAALQAVIDAGATGIVVRIDDGRHVTRAAAGKAVLDPPRPAWVNDQSRVGSITKTFIATLTLQLVGERKIGLEDSVEDWLPGLVPGGSGVTIHQLLNHTSGIFNYTDDQAWVAEAFSNPSRVWRPQELVAVATAHPPLFAPGQGWSYSNTNYVLVGLILEKVTGYRVQDLLERRIARPLHLNHTYLATTGAFRGPYLHGYIPPELTGAGYLDVSGWAPTWAWAAGAVVSTAEDLTRFYQALLSGRLLRPVQLAQMTELVPVGVPGFGYGLGLYSQQWPCGTIWGHDGGVPGYISFAYNDRSGRRSAIVLMSTEPTQAIVQAGTAALSTAVCQMFDKPVPAQSSTPTATAGIARWPFPPMDETAVLPGRP